MTQEQKIEAAWKQFMAETLPAWTRSQEAIREAQEQCASVVSEIWDQYQIEVAPSRKRYENAVLEASDDYPEGVR
jgi:hypothetical protein